MALLGAIAIGCAPGTSDVDVNATKAKEKQIEEATKKLNGGQAPQGQGQGQ